MPFQATLVASRGARELVLMTHLAAADLMRDAETQVLNVQSQAGGHLINVLQIGAAKFDLIRRNIAADAMNMVEVAGDQAQRSMLWACMHCHSH